MRYFRKNHNSFIIFAALVLAGLFVTACDSPLSLGGKINTEVPVIKIPADPDGRSQPGSYLEGEDNRIWLDVTQEFGIDYVYMTIEYELLDEFGKPSGIFTKEDVPASLDKNTGLYHVDIDTIELKMADGKFAAWVIAVDVSGKTTTSTDLFYVVKNLPPQIELTIPSVKGVNFDSEEFLAELPTEDPVFVGFDLMGLATDNLGIMPGYPKIMIWPKGEALDSNGEPLDAQYRVWRSTVLPRTPAEGEPALTATRFTWPMVKVEDTPGSNTYRWPNDGEPKTGQRYTYLDAGLYQFRILAMDMYGKPNYYPNRTDNERGPNNTRLPPETHVKYIEIDYIVADIPIVTIREIPLYFNGLEPFLVKVDVTTSNPLDSVEAFVRYKYLNAANEVRDFESPYYNLVYAGRYENTYNYEFTITEAMASSWPKPMDGNATVHFEAMDNVQKKSPPAFRSFIYDTEPPEVKFTGQFANTNIKAPGALRGGAYEIYNPIAPPRWVTGRITVSGTSFDETSGIAKVFYHIGKLDDDGFPTGDNLSDEARGSIYEDAPWIDSGLDIGAPRPGWSGNVYAWNYTSDFNDFRESTVLRNLIQLDTDLDYKTDDPYYGTTSGDHSARFYLPFYVKVLNNAGNQTVIHYKLCIDPNLDIPLVNINYPGEGDIVGGEVRLSGTAADNEWVHTVLIRIQKEGETGYYIPNTTSAFAAYPSGYSGDTDSWFRANKIGNDMVVGWYYNINGDTGLNPTNGTSVNVKIEVRAIDAKPNLNINDADRVGPAEVLNVVFSSLVPTISTPVIKKSDGIDAGRDHFEDIKTSGEFTITTTIGDNDGIKNVRARFDRDAPFIDLIRDTARQTSLPVGWAITEPVLVAGKWESTLTFTINSITNSFYPVWGYGNTGEMNLEITVEDVSEPSFRTTGRYTIGIDNFYPNAEINTHSNASGTSFLIEGTASDFRDTPMPSILGIERVIVFFEEARITYSGSIRTVNGTGRYLNPRGRAIGQSDSFYTGYGLGWDTAIPAMDSYLNMRDPSLPNNPANGPDGPNVSGSVPFPVLRLINKGGNIGEVWESPHAMVIDAQELGETLDYDNDGTHGEMWSGLTVKEWGARMDTTVFDDGPLMVHYIIMDHAGNATRYRKDIYIENNKPWITFINVGTDIDSNGTVAPYTSASAPGEYRQYPETIGRLASGNRKIEFEDPYFRVRNDRFTISLNTSGGNTGKHYSVSYVSAGATMSPSAMERGNVYTIVSINTASGAVTDWTRYGALNNTVGTTFVATGPGEGTGTVTEYDELDSITGSFPAGADDIDILIDDFTNINDSVKNSDGDIITHNDRLFIVKVYDSTVASVAGLSSPPEADQLAHAVLIAVDIDNDDSKRPAILINPFLWNNASDNSLYENQRANGHIEFETDLPSQYTDSGSGLLDRDPKVSGRISVRGTLTDNNTIDEIAFTFTGYNGGNPVTVAQFDPDSPNTVKWIEYGDFLFTPYQFRIERNNDGSPRETHDQLGHSIEWRLDIDTGVLVSTTAAVDRILTVAAVDKAANISAASTTQTTTTNRTPYYRMDVVPYISAIETPYRISGGLKPVNIRSADGKYSIIQGNESTFITVRGFNLNPTAADDVRILTEANITSHETDPAHENTLGNPIAYSLVDANRTSFLMSNDSTSGYLTVWTNEIPSLNNINNKESLGSFIKVTGGANASNGYNEENMPNREADRYITGNITLTDTRYLQFYAVRETNVLNGYYPVMLMNGDNPVFGYVDPNGGPSLVPKPGGTMASNPVGNRGAGVNVNGMTIVLPAPNSTAGSQNLDARAQRAEFDHSNGNPVYKEYLLKSLVQDQMAMAVDEAGRYGHYTVYNYNTGSTEYIYDRYAELWMDGAFGWAGETGIATTYTTWPTSNVAQPNYSGLVGRFRAADPFNTAISFEQPVASSGGQLDRFWYPKLIIRGNSITSFAANYLAYFDDYTDDIILRTFQVGTQEAAPGRQYRLSSEVALPQYDNDTPRRLYNAWTNYDVSDGTMIGNTGRNIAADNASRYFDMGILSNGANNGRVVVVYYDESTARLRLRYSNTALDGSSITGIAFTENTGITLPPNVGTYVSMAIDDDDRIHIAALDSINGELNYIFIQSYDAASFSSVKVDQFGAVGYWTSIKLHPGSTNPSNPYFEKEGTPYIAYYNMAETGNRESIKMAFAKNPVTSPANVLPGVDSEGYTTGNWEYATIPALSSPQGGRQSFQRVNLGFMTNGVPMLGYLGTNIEFSYEVGE
ncbi:MAG: hypothetical protein FWG99_08370 [Treponema sp.]|nr:hypothetical protein [Treponema sp.]